MSNPKYLWLLTQKVNTGYDTYDSAVVVAEDKKQAKLIHPHFGLGELSSEGGMWATPDKVEATKIGYCALQYKVGTVICASFNAG